ncbi:MAG: DNA/RNA non-specific endonuclease [Cyclobacteriaceae bacterium]
MAKSSTRYLLLAILIVVVFILFLVFLKDRNTRPAIEKAPAPIDQRESAPQSGEQDREARTEEESRIIPRDEFNYLPTSTTNQIIRHSNFTLSYVETHEQAEWVAYELTDQEVLGREERSDDFREDPKVNSGSASPKDYYRSGYDRGHLAPAGDMKFSDEAMSESFYMSNMSPQKPAFNRGIWRELEEQVRDWATENGSLYVVTGPIFGKSRKKLGDNKVTVPEAYYKVLLDYTEPEVKAIAFLLPNAGSKEDFMTFAVSIDSVEKVSGLDFFPALPDLQETQLESDFAPDLWLADF